MCWNEQRKQGKDRKESLSHISLFPSSSACFICQNVWSFLLQESAETSGTFVLRCVSLPLHLVLHVSLSFSQFPDITALAGSLCNVHSPTHRKIYRFPLVTLACKRVLSRSPTPTACSRSHSKSHANIPTVPHSSRLAVLPPLGWGEVEHKFFGGWGEGGGGVEIHTRSYSFVSCWLHQKPLRWIIAESRSM